MFIEGANNPGSKAHVDSDGKLEAHSVSITEQSEAAEHGDTYNLNTGSIVLTDAVETPIFYLKNDSEEQDLLISRVFLALAASTGGSADLEAIIYYNITGGTILTSGADNPPANFNASSSKTLGVTSKLGATGLTHVGGTAPIRFLIPSDNSRTTVAFEAIVLPRGASMLLALVPQTGNTSMKIQAGANVYLHEVE